MDQDNNNINNYKYKDYYNESFKDYIQHVDALKQEINIFVKSMSGNISVVKNLMDSLESDISKISTNIDIIKIACLVASIKNNILENMDVIKITNNKPLFQGLIGKLINALSENNNIVFDVTIQDYRLVFFKTIKKDIDIITKEFSVEIIQEVMDCSNDLEIAKQLDKKLNG